MNKIIIHQDRALIEIKGQDRKKFLQGLITNDINKVTDSNLIYSVMLNPQGRFLYDFFIFEIAESLFLDCLEIRRDEIIKKLRFYKLRSKVEIEKNDQLIAAQTLEKLTSDNINIFSDPRNNNLGFRVYFDFSQKDNFEQIHNDEYSLIRISNKIPESEHDLTYEKSFILEFDFDNLNAVDYKKGCYVGQELTARTHYRGQIRKKLIHITIDNLKKVEKDQKLSCEGKNLGIVLSSVFHEDKLHALALIRFEDQEDEIQTQIDNADFENNKITLIK